MKLIRISKKTTIVCAAAVALSFYGANQTQAATVVVNNFGGTGINQWSVTNQAGAATSSIDNLTGAGGNLENNQPFPTGAAHLTTTNSNTDAVAVGTSQDFGVASSTLNGIKLGYSYYKSASDTNQAAAPSLNLTIYNPNGTGSGTNRSYGQLLYEPYFQGSGNPTTDAWQTVAIDQNTGSGNDASGGWEWSGGFGVASGASGPPLRSLSEWATAFGSAGDPDFAGAHVFSLGVQIGSYNQGLNDYFDGVSFQVGSGGKTTYDFQAVPEPSSTMLIGLGLLGMLGFLGFRRRRVA